MRTSNRELLAVGLFGGPSRLGERIELLLKRGREVSPRASASLRPSLGFEQVANPLQRSLKAPAHHRVETSRDRGPDD